MEREQLLAKILELIIGQAAYNEGAIWLTSGRFKVTAEDIVSYLEKEGLLLLPEPSRQYVLPKLEGNTTFEKELEDLINRHSKENESNTPEFILAKYIKLSLMNFDFAVKHRDMWYGYKSSTFNTVDIKP